MNTETVFNATEASREEILASRCNRVEKQTKLLRKNCACVVSFTMNIPGSVKQSPAIKKAFDAGMDSLHHAFAGHILEEHTDYLIAGSEGLLALNMSASEAKRKSVLIEEIHPIGRLFDIDVLDSDGIQISRSMIGKASRKCLLCGGDAKACGRSGAHTGKELQDRVALLLNNYFREVAADRYATCIMRALLHEVSATPKPGLVDRNNSGAHGDMNFSTFLDSSAAILPWLRKMFCIGWDYAEYSEKDLFEILRIVGRQAEQTMYSATHGVNTHKGLIFSFGLLCGAIGRVQSLTTQPIHLCDVTGLCGRLGELSLKELGKTAPATSGERCLQAYHISGARGEAASGFLSAVEVGLPMLRYCVKNGCSINDASANTLLALLANMSDTNMIKRGGLNTALKKREQAGKLLNLTMRGDCLSTLEALDNEYIRENLSPGGCADVLAISLALLFFEDEGLIMP